MVDLNSDTTVAMEMDPSSLSLERTCKGVF